MDSLQSILRTTLQPVTHNLPAPLTNLGTQLLGAHCYKTLIHDLSILPLTPQNRACLSLFLSKSLGLGIVATSSVVKIPQILKLLHSGSATGISFPAYALETVALAVTLVYNLRLGFPFSTYGETVMIAVQNVVICVLVLSYQGRRGAAGAFVGALAVGVGALMGEGVVGRRELGWVQGVAGGMGVLSKVPQIWTVWREGGTGVLSAFAVFNYLLGSLARVFTTLQEVDDKLILYGFVAGFTLNAILAAQMVYYWKSPATPSHAAEMGKEPEKIAMGSSTGASPKGKGPTTRRRG